MIIPETRFTRKIALALSRRDARGRFNISFALATSCSEHWSFFLISMRRCDDGRRFYFANY